MFRKIFFIILVGAIAIGAFAFMTNLQLGRGVNLGRFFSVADKKMRQLRQERAEISQELEMQRERYEQLEAEQKKKFSHLDNNAQKLLVSFHQVAQLQEILYNSIREGRRNPQGIAMTAKEESAAQNRNQYGSDQQPFDAAAQLAGQAASVQANLMQTQSAELERQLLAFENTLSDSRQLLQQLEFLQQQQQSGVTDFIAGNAIDNQEFLRKIDALSQQQRVLMEDKERSLDVVMDNFQQSHGQSLRLLNDFKGGTFLDEDRFNERMRQIREQQQNLLDDSRRQMEILALQQRDLLEQKNQFIEDWMRNNQFDLQALDRDRRETLKQQKNLIRDMKETQDALVETQKSNQELMQDQQESMRQANQDRQDDLQQMQDLQRQQLDDRNNL